MTPSLTGVFVRKIKLRSPLVLKSLPWLARFHRAAHRQRTSRKAQLFLGAPLEKLFRLFYRWWPFPVTGLLEYQTATRRCPLVFNARNLAFDILYAEMFAENYEDETAVLLDAFLPEKGCFYDIGSNWGFFSLYVASRAEGFRIHAFEPIPPTYRDLVSCVEQAGLQKTIQCYPVALSDTEGHTFFQVPFHSASAQVEKEGQGVRVETRTVDGMKLAPPDFMKIDAEGHEAAVLHGSEATLRAAKPFIMFENKLYRQAPRETLEPLALLRQHGYHLFVPTVARAWDDTTYFVNCGYQMDTGRMQKIEREDTLVLVPCEPARRFLFPNYLNIFACHQDRLEELRARFEER
jgi:FkbM family methyltransferase